MNPNPTLTRPEKQARTRTRLIDAAARVFGRRGYRQATLEEIASEAGHTTGAVYSNFSSKEELFLALADREVAERLAEVRTVMEAAARPEDVEPEVAEQFRAFIARDPEWPLLFYEFWSSGVRDPRLREEFDRRRQDIRAAIAEALRTIARQQRMKLRYPAEQLAGAISAVVNGLAFERAADPDSLPPEVVGFSVWSLLENACVPLDGGDD
jgi:AcrR family transcriptional regulator